MITAFSLPFTDRRPTNCFVCCRVSTLFFFLLFFFFFYFALLWCRSNWEILACSRTTRIRYNFAHLNFSSLFFFLFSLKKSFILLFFSLFLYFFYISAGLILLFLVVWCCFILKLENFLEGIIKFLAHLFHFPKRERANHAVTLKLLAG